MKKRLPNSTKILATIVMLVLFGLTGKAQTWTIYDGSFVPGTTTTPPFAVGDSWTQTNIPMTSDGNILTVTAPAGNTNKGTQKSAITAAPTAATWMIRTRTVYTVGTYLRGIDFEFDGSVNRAQLTLVYDATGTYWKFSDASNVSVSSALNFDIQNFHTYRITTSDGTNFQLYIDENPTAINLASAKALSSATLSWKFGVTSTTAAQREGEIDWAAWDNTAAYAPGSGTLPAGVIVDGAGTTTSNDATLKDLQVNGTTVAGFASGTTTYNVVLPYGTTTIPTIAATVNESHATTVITQPASVTGSGTVVVTAQDGTTTQTYTVNFSVAAAVSNDATLSALTVSAGTLSPVFASGTTAYNVVLPYGTTTVPTIAATVNESHATTVITQAASVTGSGTVVVTAQDGTTTQTYTVTFSVVAASTDATLSALTVSAGTLSPVFAAGTTSYTVALPAETTTIPTVSATANESHATVTVTQAATLTGSASVLVTAQDGTTKTTYTINFSLAAPAAPVASAATSITKTSLSANWAASTGATGYYLDVATDNAFANFVTGFNNKDVANVTTFSVAGLTTATTYYYRVRAYNAGGTSASSNTITALSLGTAVPSLSADELTIAVSANAVDIESSNNTIIAVQVVNVNGKQVAEKNVNSTSATISTDGWSSGMYVFIIKTQDQVITKKLGIVK